jgi:cholesterol oxidase
VSARFRRRSVLKASTLGVAGAGVSVAGLAEASSPAVEERRRAVVIGTGFGGSVTALRLARAGIPTLVLERGLRWPARPGGNTFPRLFAPDKRASWLTPGPVMTGSPPGLWAPYTGVLERVRGRGMDILCGAGVGGGSLVYHGMTIQPSEEAFARSMPPGLDWTAFDQDYYRRVEARLRPAPIPRDLLGVPRYRAARQFHDRVLGAGLRPFRVPLPLDWDVVRRELRGELPPSYSTGDVIYGANNAGKRTLDVTYLAEAEASGLVQVQTLSRVRDIERDKSGRWVVHVDRITTDGRVAVRRRIVTDHLFLGAGSAGTTRLLVKAKAKNLIPDLPDDVGKHWGNNGDRIFAWTPPGDSPGALQGGPACVGVRSPDLTVIHGPVPFPLDVGTTSLIGFGLVKPLGEFRYDRVTDDAVLHWKQAYDAELTAAIRSRITGIVGGSLLIDTTRFDTTTYHPLGGAVIGAVCDRYGRVHGQRGLHVVDGALIPGSTGACNPSMTIAALAERNLDAIIPSLL